MLRAFVSLGLLACVSFLGCGGDSKKTGGGGSGGATAGAGGAAGSAGSGGAGGSAGSGSGGSAGGGSGGRGGMGGSGGAGTGGSGGTGGAGGSAGRDGGAPDASASARDGGATSPMMSFFVTSRSIGKGGDLGGLAGADAHCKMLATAVSAALGAKNWKAYLSTSAENARDRIGSGPWFNARGAMIARNLAELHDQGAMSPLNQTWPIGSAAYDVVLDERGQSHRDPFMGRTQHDILTGSTMDGRPNGNAHCNNWTSQTGMSTVGHSNRDGGGRPPSWNSAHESGCGPEVDANGQQRNGAAGTVTQGGGRGWFYCFAAQ